MSEQTAQRPGHIRSPAQGDLGDPAASSAPTPHPSTSSGRPRSTSSASTDGPATSATSSTTTRGTARTLGCSARRPSPRWSSAAVRTSPSTSFAMPRCRPSSPRKGGHPKVAMVFLDEETERICAELGYELVLPPRRATPPAGLQDRDHGPRQRGRGPQRAERPHRGRLVGHAGPRRHRGRPGHRPRRPDPLRGLRQDDVLPLGRGRLGHLRRRHRRPAGQGHEADQQQGCGGRGRPDPARHHRRALHDRPHRISRAHAVQGRVVWQRPVPRRAVRRASRQGCRARPPTGREAGAGGLRRLLRGRRPRRPRHRRRLPG